MMHKTTQFVLISFSVAFLIGNSYSDNYGTTNVTTAKVIKSLIKEDLKYIKPRNDHNNPNLVNIHLVIRSIDDLSEQSSNFDIRYYLTLYWYDSRLKFMPFMENNKTIDKIYLPISIVNENGMYLH